MTDIAVPKEQKTRRITNRVVNLLIKFPSEVKEQLILHLNNEYGKFIKISRAHREKGHTEICSKDIIVADYKQEDTKLHALSVTIKITHRTTITYGFNQLKTQLCALLNIPKGMISIVELKAPAVPKPAETKALEAEAKEPEVKAAVEIPQIDPVMLHIVKQPIMEKKEEKLPELPVQPPISYVKAEVARIEAQPKPEVKVETPKPAAAAKTAKVE